jgi:hypothetical protein
MSRVEALRADIHGMTRDIDRAADAIPAWQEVREMVVNAAEAGATQVWIDYWVDAEGHALLRITDNGTGMGEELRDHIATLYLTGKNDSIDGNYGIGARLASLGRNPGGVTWATRQSIDDEFRYDRCVTAIRDDLEGYGLQRFATDEGQFALVAPDEGMLELLDNEASGTAVIFHGNGNEDTWKRGTGSEIAKYLRQRFYHLPVAVKVLRLEGEKSEFRAVDSLHDIWALRTRTTGSMELSDGALLTWTVMETGAEAARQLFGGTAAVIAAQLDDELFGVDTCTGDRYRHFGVSLKSTMNRLGIVIEPRHFRDDPINGFRMNRERSHIEGRKGRGLPWAQWGEEFFTNMPPEVAALIADTAPKHDREALRQRVIDRFGQQWRERLERTARLVTVEDGEEAASPENPVRTRPERRPAREIVTRSADVPPRPRPKKPAQRGGEGTGSSTRRPDLPDYEWVVAEEMTEPGLAATWTAPRQMITLNREHRVFVEEVRQYARHYPTLPRGTVQDQVEEAYGMEYVAKVTHVKLLEGSEGWGEHETEMALLPQCMTTWALGFNAVSQCIEESLGQLGRRSA